MKTSENYKGYAIKFSDKRSRYEAKKGRKTSNYNANLDALKSSIDAWVGNTELSQRIAAEPQGISSNINIIRK